MKTALQACGEELCYVVADSPFVAIDDYMRNKNHCFVIKSPGDSEWQIKKCEAAYLMTVRDSEAA